MKTRIILDLASIGLSNKFKYQQAIRVFMQKVQCLAVQEAELMIEKAEIIDESKQKILVEKGVEG